MNRRASITGGAVLILLGLIFLASEIFPGVFNFWEWPFFIIGFGGLFLVWAILSGVGGLAVPGAIISGIGGILYYQNVTGDWTSWSYIWALIPGFVGVGVFLANLIDGKIREAFTDSITLVLISAMLFFAFGTAFGLEHNIAQYWPVLLILLGIIALFKAFFPAKKRTSSQTRHQEPEPVNEDSAS
jgi:hypothetical protein